MFTTQRKGWQTPKSVGGGGGLGTGSVSNALKKGKTEAFVDRRPLTPLGNLSGIEERGLMGYGEDGCMDDVLPKIVQRVRSWRPYPPPFRSSVMNDATGVRLLAGIHAEAVDYGVKKLRENNNIRV